MGENKPINSYRGRLAPTPSGYLHDGHVSTFRTAWQRALGGSLVFRMDDLDPKRCSLKYADACKDDLKGIGIDWNEGPDCGGLFGPYKQSDRGKLYLEALSSLLDIGMIYPCTKSRKEIGEVGLKSISGDEFLFPENWSTSKKIKGVFDFPGSTNWRFRTRWGDKISFFDQNKKYVEYTVGLDFSDFVVWRKEGFASYELATVVDDHKMQITEVVRGMDLLLSSARQCMIYDALGWGRPKFYHCDLVTDCEGRKLSKSSRDLPRLFTSF